ncbi:hypothetical protein DXG01_016720 [Tephrocybe rancida]|nr:hypothetical protein DXG01_016720 [Tephrocybe rancida]
MHHYSYIGSPSRWRLLRPVLVIIVVASLLISYIFLKSRPSYAYYDTLAKHEEAESRRLIRNSPENKYVLFKQLQGAGFNNQAQEILLFHHLALQSSRVYVYQPVIWRPSGAQAKVPLTAFIPGIARNSISSVVFNEACSAEETKHINIKVTNLSLWEYTKLQLSGNEKCIVVDNWILNWDFLASAALHDIWPEFKKYLASHFQWSDAIQSIAQRAHQDLNLRSSNDEGEPYIALHFRRGDFEGHCQSLAARQTGFTTWATLPSLQPSISSPRLDTANSTSITEHCYPPLHRIVTIINSLVRDRPHLRTLHVLHDGAWDHPLVYAQHYSLKATLTAKGGPITRVTHSGQVPIGWGEADWAVSVDTELARRAEVFVGNGYSSLSTQVVALRLGADGGRVEDIALL